MKRLFTSTPILLAIISVASLAFTQDSLPTAPPFEVNRMRPFVSIHKAELAAANTLLDINPRYNADWVKTYESVRITTVQEGRVLTKVGKSDTLTPEQKEQLLASDLGTEISVLVRYMPENNLKQNDLQGMNFSFSLEADIDATFPGDVLNYLNERAIKSLSAESFGEWGMSAVQFTVDEGGRVEDVKAVEPVQDSTISNLLVKTICNLPLWNPAQYEDGTTVAQKFALTVGNQENCKIALLNIKDLE